MKRKQRLLTHIGAVALSVSCFSMAAQAAIGEKEPNSSVSDAQVVNAGAADFSVSGSLQFLGTDAYRRPIRDVDFYTFQAAAGDNLDIGVSGVSASVALFGEGPDYERLADDSSGRIKGYKVAKNGMYTVAVANSGALFLDGGSVSLTAAAYEQGSYTLSVGGFAQRATEVEIDVYPRKSKKKTSRIKMWKKNRVKVAILGSDTFKVSDVDTSSLRFGSNGDEKTLKKCKRRYKDVNRDGYKDLVCKFALKGSGFTAESTNAVLTGKTKSGAAFYGSEKVEVKESKKVARWARDERKR